MTEKLQKSNELMLNAAKEGVFPSASLLVARGGEILFKNAYGNCDLCTIFDVASLTKPVVTTTLAMFAVQKGLLRLEDSIERFFPQVSEDYKKIAVWNLLNHSSGLPAWQPYYQEVPQEQIASVEGRSQIVDTILNESLIYETGTKSLYSDLGFILLGEILEKAFSDPLNLLAEKFITGPLGMKGSFYRAVKKTSWSTDDFQSVYTGEERGFDGVEFVPTEDCPWRGEVISGIVHDQNCYAMGGIAGHAGLFSTVGDLHLFVRALISSKRGEGDFIQKDIVDRFIDDYASTLEFSLPGTFLLGWDRPRYKNSQAGSKFSPRSIGHLGYTGCSLWIDLEKGFWVILLSNRVHPTTTNQKIKTLRPILHDTIFDELTL